MSEVVVKQDTDQELAYESMNQLAEYFGDIYGLDNHEWYCCKTCSCYWKEDSEDIFCTKCDSRICLGCKDIADDFKADDEERGEYVCYECAAKRQKTQE